MKIAVIETGGKQYLVKEGQTLRIEKVLPANSASAVKSILLAADGDKVSIGAPSLVSTTVEATTVGEGRSKKVIVEKFKSKVRYHKKQGHRQSFTSLKISKISA